jgi:hypothetical protein
MVDGAGEKGTYGYTGVVVVAAHDEFTLYVLGF